MSIRSRLERIFIDWLEEARPRLALQPHIARRTCNHVFLHFEGITSGIEVAVWRERKKARPDYIRVDVTQRYGGPLWADSYFSREILLQRHSGRYEAGEKFTTEFQIFASRAEACRALLFEPFLRWVNEELAPAKGIAVGEVLAESYSFPLGSGDGAHSFAEPVWISSHWLIKDSSAGQREGVRIAYVIPLNQAAFVRERRHDRRLRQR